MKGNFGVFVCERRKNAGITLRALAAQIGIAPAYMSDIEKGRRYPPNKEKLYQIAQILELTKDETNKMFDLAGEERENTVSPDLSEYIMNNECVRVALRLARDTNVGDDKWQKLIDMMESQ